MSLFLTISGCDGGSGGPRGIYKHFQDYSSDTVKFVSVETIPDEIDSNIERVIEIARKNMSSYKKMYLVGYSMGGTIAALSACKLNSTANGSIQGVILIDTQTDGLHVLKTIKIPTLFFHGSNDQVFPLWQIESVFDACSLPKKLVQIENLDHNLRRKGEVSNSKDFIKALSKVICSEITQYFWERVNESNVEIKDVVSLNVTAPNKTGFCEWVFKSLFSSSSH